MLRAAIITITVVITLCVLPAGSVSAHPAWGIVIDRNNQIYFSDLETIWKIDAQGKLTVFRAGLSGRHTHEITLDENGYLYGVDNDYEPATQRSIAALWKITPAGEFSYVLPPTYNPPKGMTNWKDRAGNSYYVGQSENAKHELFVLKRTPDGKVTTLAGSEKSASAYRQVVLYSLGGMAFGTDGALYFTDNANIRKVSMDGKMTMLARNLAVENRAESAMPESSSTRVFGIAVDERGNAFVADYGNRCILKVTPGGVVSTVARAEQPWSPTGVALKDGNLYILEFGFTPPSKYTPRVRKLSADGKVMVLATVGDVEKSSGQKGSTDGNVQSLPVYERSAPNVLIGMGVGIFALALRLVRKEKNVRPSALRDCSATRSITDMGTPTRRLLVCLLVFTHRLTGDQYGFEALSFIITETHPGGGPGLHVHDTEEAHVLLEGSVQYRIADKTFTVQGPYVARVPAGVSHTFIDVGRNPFNLIAVFASKHPNTKRIGPNPLIPAGQNREEPRSGLIP